MQTLDIRFLHNLREKLIAGNRRSIYLHALPGRYLTRLDLADLGLLQTGLPKDFLDCLLSKAQFSFPINLASNNNSDKDTERKQNWKMENDKENHEETKQRVMVVTDSGPGQNRSMQEAAGQGPGQAWMGPGRLVGSDVAWPIC